jgi:hypothetical protein
MAWLRGTEVPRLDSASDTIASGSAIYATTPRRHHSEASDRSGSRHRYCTFASKAPVSTVVPCFIWIKMR